MKYLLTLLALATATLACEEKAALPPPAPAAPPVAAAPAAPPATKPSVAPVAPVAPPTPPPPPVVEAPPPEPKTLSEAVAQFLPFFGDQGADDPLPTGAGLFSLWAINNLKWHDIKALPQTKRSLVMKDPDEERGKSLCVAGKVIEIAVEKLDEGKVAHAGIMNPDWDVFKVIAVGSSGELVEGKMATFCGVVIGKASYRNSAGGHTHAIRLVGMFDLPANRRR